MRLPRQTRDSLPRQAQDSPLCRCSPHADASGAGMPWRPHSRRSAPAPAAQSKTPASRPASAPPGHSGSRPPRRRPQQHAGPSSRQPDGWSRKPTKNTSWLSAFPKFVPSLSWEKDRFRYEMLQQKVAFFRPRRTQQRSA